MPELPEVETVAQQLRPELRGCKIVDVEVLWERTVNRPDVPTFCAALTGARFLEVGRRGKFILMALDTGQTLLAHLRMTGKWLIRYGPPCPKGVPHARGPRPNKRSNVETLKRSNVLVGEGEEEEVYDRVRLTLDDGRRLVFADTRKFGRLYLVDDPAEVVGSLGPEPLGAEFTPERFAAMLSGRSGRIKPLLLNQTFLAGLGNIYTDEALWRARIHPLQRADTLTREQVARLHAGITAVLREAIEEGGTSLRDNQYRQPDGTAGEFQIALGVYGRAKQPCPECGTIILRIVVGQRGTHLCPVCQVLSD